MALGKTSKELRIFLLLKQHRWLSLVAGVFVLIYALISLVNHYVFRTHALDLGLYTHAAYRYAHFQLADAWMVKKFFEPLLASHFDLYLILFSPFTYLFGSYTLLLIQIAAICAGGVGVYRFLLLKFQDQRLAIWGAVYFYSFFGVLSAIAFDYHSVVVASSIMPWFLLAVKREDWYKTTGLFIALIIAQENVAFWVSFVCLALAIEHRKNRRANKILLGLFVVSIGYFLMITQVVMPSFAASNTHQGFLYSVLGTSVWEAMIYLLSHPIESIKLLFVNHLGAPEGNYIKLEFHLFALLSGLYLLFRKPTYLIMLIPLYAQKLYHDNISIWGVGGQYAIEFAPILALGAFDVLGSIESRKIRNSLLIILMIGSLGVSVRSMDHTVQFTDKTRLRFYQGSHYRKAYDVALVHEQLDRIPADAIISAQSPFVPHLALREHIYKFPIVKNAEYIVYSTAEGTYPYSEEQFNKKTTAYLDSPEWEVYYKGESLVVLKHIDSLSE